MLVFEEIRFDMSREGLVELSAILEMEFSTSSEELQNFANEIRNKVQRAPAAAVKQESSWLDE